MNRPSQLKFNLLWWGAAIAQWICLHLPSCRPGSSPKHTIYAFINLCWFVSSWKDENKQIEAGIGHFFKKKFNLFVLQ